MHRQGLAVPPIPSALPGCILACVTRVLMLSPTVCAARAWIALGAARVWIVPARLDHILAHALLLAAARSPA